MNTGVGCHALLQEIFPTQGSKPGLLHCRQIFYCLSHQALAQYSMARSTHFEGQKYIQFSSVQSLSHVRLFETPWTAARQASLSITYSWSLLKIMSIELLMPSTISFSVVITRILKKIFFKYSTRIIKKKRSFNIETMNRDSQEYKNTQITRSLEYIFENKHK